MREGYFRCFTRLQHVAFRHGIRITNRCFTDALLPREPQVQLKPKPMRQEDVAAVRTLTGYGPFVEVKYV